MKLSVVIITYNQVSFIRQCMESVLAQQFDASWEIVVADDASSDGTAQILGDYAQRHPHLIQLVTATANQGLVGNLRRALAVARGEYIAYLDGDDYWTDPRKLARQVAILDAHPEAVLSFHASRILIDHHPGGLLT
ncbi:MAG: glycosyltransferase family 2 protein, partial [Thiotrichales bacterium]